MSLELKHFEGVAPSGPKPAAQRPTLLRSAPKGPKRSKSLKLERKSGGTEGKAEKAEVDANLLAFELIKCALNEDAKVALEDDMFCESEDSFDEMDDDVLSLCCESESEEEADLVDLAYSFAKGVVGQGAEIDFVKAVQDASDETPKDFVEIADFISDAEDEEDLHVNADSGDLGQAEKGGLDKHVESAEAQDLQEGLNSLRQKAKQSLLSAAGDGRLAVALTDVKAARDELVQVESLRLEARDAMLKAAANGSLADALKQMGKVREAKAAALVSDVNHAEEIPISIEGSDSKRPQTEDLSSRASRAMKLAWCMAGPPARSLRQKEVRKAFGRPCLQAYPPEVQNQVEDHKLRKSELAEKSGSGDKTAQPRMTGSASAISLGLHRAKVVGMRCASSRCSSVGSLRPLKVKGPVLPPALPPTAFLQRHEQAAKQGV